MTQPTPSARSFRKDKRGSILVLSAIMITAIVGFAGLVVDVANIYLMKSRLQATTDLAATAAALDINCCSSAPGTALTTANTYSSKSGGLNVIPNVTVTSPTGYPKFRCLTSTSISCSGPDNANAVVVRQQTTLPLTFAGVFKVSSVTVTATATAIGRGGVLPPLNVMFVLDTTGSMNSSDPNCSIKNATRLQCAMAGLRTMLSQLDTRVDWVGLSVFPPLTNASQAAYEYDCNSKTSPSISAYGNNPPKTPLTPVYQVIGLAQADYRTSNTSTSLNTASNIVKAAGGGGTGCTAGLAAVGGVGTYFADAITDAQAKLAAVSRPGVQAQNVMIVLSDGDAGADSQYMTSTKYANQCRQAITAADAAAATGTWVYAIAYGASNSSSSSCTTDSPKISACSTMQQVASDASKFYADTTGTSGACASSANPIHDLVGIFQNITNDLRTTQLVPDNTQ